MLQLVARTGINDRLLLFSCLFFIFRHLATGETLRSLAFQFRTHHTWISRILHSTLHAIVKNLTATAMPPPTEDIWKKNANDFEAKWSYPNCIGAIDGKHIRIRCMKNTGSLCYNYKDFYSIVLLAIVDANYKFVAVDVGSYGREGDAGVFMRSNFGKRISNGTFSIPPMKNLPGTDIALPHVIVGDEAFGLHRNLMKSYPRRAAMNDGSILTYNYRHSHARRVSENAFGILSSIFRIYFTPIHCSIDHINNLVMATCVLYNLMRTESINNNHQFQTMDTLPTASNLAELLADNTRSTEDAHKIRDAFKEYFNGIGKTPWQDEHINTNF